MQITFSAVSATGTPPLPATHQARLQARLIEQDRLPPDLDAATTEAMRAARFTGKTAQVHESFHQRGDRVVRLAMVGIGTRGEGFTGSLERAGAALAARYQTSGETAMALDLGGCGLSAEEAGAVLLGLRLRNWRYDLYRTRLKDEDKLTLAAVEVVGAPDGTEAAWQRELAVAEGVEFARELVTEPANVIYPESFVERCLARLAGLGAEMSFLDEAQMDALGMGALLGVAQGSRRAARLLVIKWLGGEAGAAPTVLVGKGVTFDTGGISIKPAAGMEDMKWDMGGAGAVAGAMLALAGRKARTNVIGICGLVENMPDGNAQRPGDVVTSMSGQTVEVINTDAEGRLVLCDAMTFAQREFKPACIIDLATLTGAMIVALGHEYGGLFSNNDDLAEALANAGKGCGDRLWRFPLGPCYDKLIDSPIADMKNVGGRWAGSITAAQFLQRFVENDTPWAHLDIAGMVWADKAGATWGKGATGYGVRLIDRYVRERLEA